MIRKTVERRKEIRETKLKTDFIPGGVLPEILGVGVPLGPGHPYLVKKLKFATPDQT